MIVVRRGSLAGFFLGLLLGASIVHAATVSERMALTTKSHELALTASRWHHETDKLRQELGDINQRYQKGLYIQSVDVIMTHRGISQVDVTAALEPYTESLLGAPLNMLKVSVVYHLFAGRVVSIGGHLYRVHVDALLLSPTTSLMVHLTRVNQPETT